MSLGTFLLLQQYGTSSHNEYIFRQEWSLLRGCPSPTTPCVSWIKTLQPGLVSVERSLWKGRVQCSRGSGAAPTPRKKHSLFYSLFAARAFALERESLQFAASNVRVNLYRSCYFCIQIIMTRYWLLLNRIYILSYIDFDKCTSI